MMKDKQTSLAVPCPLPPLQEQEQEQEQDISNILTFPHASGQRKHSPSLLDVLKLALQFVL